MTPTDLRTCLGINTGIGVREFARKGSKQSFTTKKAEMRVCAVPAFDMFGARAERTHFVLQRGFQCRNRVEEVCDEAVVGDLKDRGLFVFVDGHNHLAVFHARKVLDRA